MRSGSRRAANIDKLHGCLSRGDALAVLTKQNKKKRPPNMLASDDNGNVNDFNLNKN